MKNKFIAGIIILVLIIAGAIIYQYTKGTPSPKFIEGEESLEITILDLNGNPVNNLEVDLWTTENPSGPPSAGYLTTDNEGKVLFRIPEGGYLIGFNSVNFPEEFIYPEKTSVSVEKGENSKTLILELK